MCGSVGARARGAACGHCEVCCVRCAQRPQRSAAFTTSPSRRLLLLLLLLLLPQILFYARLLGDILGRMVPPAWQLRSSKSVLTAAFIKTKLLVVLVPAILQPSLVGGDLALATLVAVNWWLSGYINTGAYLLAPRLATLEAQDLAGSGVLGGKGEGAGRKGGKGSGWRWFWGLRRRGQLVITGKGHGGSDRRGECSGALTKLSASTLRSKAGAVMSFCFQTSCFLGLLGAWLVQEVLHESGHPAFAGAGKAAGVAAAAAAAVKAAGQQLAAAKAAGVTAAAGGVATSGERLGNGSVGGVAGAAAAAFAAAVAAVTGRGAQTAQEVL